MNILPVKIVLNSSKLIKGLKFDIEVLAYITRNSPKTFDLMVVVFL